MTREERAKRVHNYFAVQPKPPIKDYIKAALGFLIIIVGIHIAFLVVIGLVILAWGGIGIARYFRKVAATRPKATDTEIDAWLDAALVPTARNGAKRLNIHPTELTGPMEESWLIFVGFPNLANVQNRRGDDKKLRYSHYEILVVFLSNWRLPVYQVTYDVANDVAAYENTKEYNLGQVDGIETSNDRINVLSADTGTSKDGKQAATSTSVIGHVTTAQVLSLMVSGNQAVTLITGVTEKESVRVENVDDSSSIDSGISRLREHLRARHQGTYPAGAALPGGGAPSLGAGADLTLDAPASPGLDLPHQAISRPDALAKGPDWTPPGPDL